MDGHCTVCGLPLLWGGMQWVHHNDSYHDRMRRRLLRTVRNQLRRRVVIRSGHWITISFTTDVAWARCACGWRGGERASSNTARADANGHLAKLAALIEMMPVTISIKAVTVSCLSRDDIDAQNFALTVEYRGNNKWAVIRPNRKCLSAHGEWHDESPPDGRSIEWLDAHRFDLDTSLRLAKAHAPFMTAVLYGTTWETLSE